MNGPMSVIRVEQHCLLKVAVVYGADPDLQFFALMPISHSRAVFYAPLNKILNSMIPGLFFANKVVH